MSAAEVDTQENEQAISGDLLNMSDEEFEKTNEEVFLGEPQPFQEPEETGVTVYSEDTEDTNEEEADDSEDVSEDDTEDEDESLGDDGHEGDDDLDVNDEHDQSNAEDQDENQADEDGEAGDDQPSSKDGDESADEDTIDYEAEYKKLFEPIKANGKIIKMRNAEQIVNRIQLAENYHKKMHDMRPYNTVLKTLERADLIDNEEELNFLIELKQKNPEAIRKLINESGIDKYELTDDDKMEKAKTYRPQNHMVDESEVEIEDALRSISESDKYDETVQVMTKVMDAKSRDIIAENPNYIKSLNHDIETGIYETVMDNVSYQREMGELPAGISDIEAYIGTVQLMAKQEEAAAGKQSTPDMKSNPKKQTRKPNAKKRKAMATPSGRRAAGKKQYNPMDLMEMSDEDFTKEFGDGIL